jgi:hypothetical protein
MFTASLLCGNKKYLPKITAHRWTGMNDVDGWMSFVSLSNLHPSKLCIALPKHVQTDMLAKPSKYADIPMFVVDADYEAAAIIIPSWVVNMAKKCKGGRFIAIPFAVKLVQYTKFIHGHLTVLLYDRQLCSMERFDPYGSSFSPIGSSHPDVDSSIHRLFYESGLPIKAYHGVHDLPEGPQTLQEREQLVFFIVFNDLTNFTNFL